MKQSINSPGQPWPVDALLHYCDINNLLLRIFTSLLHHYIIIIMMPIMKKMMSNML